MTTQGRAHLPSLQSEYWEYSETVSIETPQGKQKRVSSARDRLIRSWREILANSKTNPGVSVRKNHREETLLKEIKKDLREKGGYLRAWRYSPNAPIRMEIHTSSFQYRQALFPRQLLTSKIKDAGVVDEYGRFSEEYLNLYYSLPWELYFDESIRLESHPLFDSNCSLDDEKVLRSEAVYAQSIVKTPRECEQLILKLRRAAGMLRALPLKKAAKFLETPVEDFENEFLPWIRSCRQKNTMESIAGVPSNLFSSHCVRKKDLRISLAGMYVKNGFNCLRLPTPARKTLFQSCPFLPGCRKEEPNVHPIPSWHSF